MAIVIFVCILSTIDIIGYSSRIENDSEWIYYKYSDIPFIWLFKKYKK